MNTICIKHGKSTDLNETSLKPNELGYADNNNFLYIGRDGEVPTGINALGAIKIINDAGNGITLGGTSTPIYLSGGSFETCSDPLNVLIKDSANKITIGDQKVTIGLTSKPVFINNGSIEQCKGPISTPCLYASVLAYVNSNGVLTPRSKGSKTEPVYFNSNGAPEKCDAFSLKEHNHDAVYLKPADLNSRLENYIEKNTVITLPSGTFASPSMKASSGTITELRSIYISHINEKGIYFQREDNRNQYDNLYAKNGALFFKAPSTSTENIVLHSGNTFRNICSTTNINGALTPNNIENCASIKEYNLIAVTANLKGNIVTNFLLKNDIPDYEPSMANCCLRAIATNGDVVCWANVKIWKVTKENGNPTLTYNAIDKHKDFTGFFRIVGIV